MENNFNKTNNYWGIIVFFLCLHLNINAQQPTAEIISEDVAFCESGDAVIKIKFTGTAPFAFDYIYDGSTYFEDGGGNINDDNFEFTINISSSSTIELAKVYDAIYPPTGNGSSQISGDMNVQIDQLPIISAGDNINKCGYEVDLNGTISGTTNIIMWSDASSGGSFSDFNSPTSQYQNTIPDTYTLTLTAENGSCKVTDEVEVTLKGRPTGSFANINVEKFCSTDGNKDISIDLNFAGVAPFTYKLKNADGSLTYGDFTSTGLSDNPTINVTKSETISFLSIQDAQNCMSETEDMTGNKPITDVKPDTQAGEGNDKFCGNEYILNAVPSEGTTGLWSSSHPNISFGDATSANTTAIMEFMANEDLKQATLKWTETSTDEFSCANFGEITVNYILKPTVEIESLSKDRICEKEDQTAINLILNKDFPLTISYNTGGSTITEALTTPILIIKGEDLNAGDNTISITEISDSYNCSDNLSISEEVYVDIMPFANAGSDIDSCDVIVQLNAIPDYDDGEWKLADGTFTNRLDPQSEFRANATGVQELYWKEINGTCNDVDTVKVNFSGAPSPVKETTDSITIYATTSLQLNADSLIKGNGLWSANDESGVTFSNDTLHNSYAHNLEANKTYNLTWKATLESAPQDKCRHKYYYVNVTSKPLFSPTGISPNGDGINEVLKIKGVEHISNNKLSVFDQKGKLVYKKEGYENDWGGKDSGGSDLPAGTYYYVFDGDELSTPIRDYLIIKRK
ncbi:gliding motility-associated C-terminal domain-containing protein [Labilibacter marinus]|uniref:gliding motility-associated C-terminal domain-containing protein n=1 Tax=Labilibacter marinus TaxID=1477105 RepID=UPI00094FF908|nr:gliding motility-associated C-terminal domain-containing protein [Labilibacter marinus]